MKIKIGKTEYTITLKAILRVAGTSGNSTDSREVSTFLDISDEEISVSQPLIKDIAKEIDCISRTDSEWETMIETIKGDDLRAWAASLAWWNYSGNPTGYLFSKMSEYNFNHTHTRDEVEKEIKRIGFSSKSCAEVMKSLRKIHEDVEFAISKKAKKSGVRVSRSLTKLEVA
jgi:tetrahydromethanopterin S-methyltransferase subunit G